MVSKPDLIRFRLAISAESFKLLTVATIKDVAALAGVSVGTVSNVLSGRVRVRPHVEQRVRSAILDLGYEPNQVARSLKLKQTQMIAMVIPDIVNPFFPSIVRGAERVALEHGYVLVTFNTDDDVELERKVLSIIRARGFDGLLLTVAPNQGDDSHISDAVNAGLRVVYLDRKPSRMTSLDAVLVNNRKGSEMAVRHLVQRGHRRIGMLAGPQELQTASERLAGYKDVLREASLKIDPALIRYGDFRIGTGYTLGKDLLLTRRPPTAVFVSNGQMAVGFLKAMAETGRACPDEVAVVCFDDIPLSDMLKPSLTAVAQPAYEIGRRGADLLIGRIERTLNELTPVTICLDPELKIRESTCRLGSNPARKSARV